MRDSVNEHVGLIHLSYRLTILFPHPIKRNKTMYKWLFSTQERKSAPFIAVYAMNIILSTGIAVSVYLLMSHLGL